MTQLFNHTVPNFTILTQIRNEPIAAVVVGIATVVAAPVIEIESVAYILGWLFIVDLISGLFASYFVWKENVPKGKFFFRANDSKEPIPDSEKGFSSDKFKKCFLKGIIYGLFPLIVIKFQEVFFIKNFKFSSITNSEFNLTVMVLLLFCANELFSIFWENLPKCGINIPKGIRDLIVGVKDVAKEIKEE